MDEIIHINGYQQMKLSHWRKACSTDSETRLKYRSTQGIFSMSLQEEELVSTRTEQEAMPLSLLR
ncbi:hypothetical protein KCP73_01565 [Salmonella enterica subsp. enterica]|nr:hypothetical protein KCP73_01565 [Salmonella enterica subsp. enterica]